MGMQRLDFIGPRSIVEAPFSLTPDAVVVSLPETIFGGSDRHP
jgi:hypothetical protein